MGCHRTYSDVERGFFLPQIQRILSCFPRSRVLFIEQRQLLEQHEATLDRICDFLGVARFVRYPERLVVRPVPAPPGVGRIPDESAALLARLYAPDTLQTARLTGLDLSHWRSYPKVGMARGRP